MAKIALTGTPTDLIATSGLTAGTTYSIKVELPAAGGQHNLERPIGPFVRINDTGAAAPTDRNDGWPLAHLDEAIISSGDDDTLWAWASRGGAVINAFPSS